MECSCDPARKQTCKCQDVFNFLDSLDEPQIKPVVMLGATGEDKVCVNPLGRIAQPIRISKENLEEMIRQGLHPEDYVVLPADVLL